MRRLIITKKYVLCAAISLYYSVGLIAVVGCDHGPAGPPGAPPTTKCVPAVGDHAGCTVITDGKTCGYVTDPDTGNQVALTCKAPSQNNGTRPPYGDDGTDCQCY